MVFKSIIAEAIFSDMSRKYYVAPGVEKQQGNNKISTGHRCVSAGGLGCISHVAPLEGNPAKKQVTQMPSLY